MENALPLCESPHWTEDIVNIGLRHRALSHFAEFPLIKCFLLQVRRNKVVSSKSVELVVLSDVKPVRTNGLTVPGHIRCKVTEKNTRAWPLGAVGSVDHQLYITEKAEVMTLTNTLQHDGQTVIGDGNRFPIKGLVPFDASVLCDEHLSQLIERIHELGHQTHKKH